MADNCIYYIRNVVNGAAYRGHTGEIQFFMSMISAQDFIDRHLPSNLWEPAVFRR